MPTSSESDQIKKKWVCPKTSENHDPRTPKFIIRSSSSSSTSDAQTQTLPKSAIQRIADKLRTIGFTEDTPNPGPGPNENSAGHELVHAGEPNGHELIHAGEPNGHELVHAGEPNGHELVHAGEPNSGAGHGYGYNEVQRAQEGGDGAEDDGEEGEEGEGRRQCADAASE